MTTRFPVAVDDPLRNAGWQPGRWDIRQAEQWADTLRGHLSPGGHRHAVFPAAVEVWAEFGGLHIVPTGPGRHIAPSAVHIDPLSGLHAARTFNDLGRALGTQVCPIGTEGEYTGPGETADGDDGGHYSALLAIDAQRRVYSLDATGDWYLGIDFDSALSALLMGHLPAKLSAGAPPAPRPADDLTSTDAV
ncbi:SUKH-3 domain-containing protein [Streptomyces albus]|uniref:SUKH-3 domain-containing protein n=1 Tax=Streptomyces albus TaxID=1888 RepID=UPI003404CA64